MRTDYSERERQRLNRLVRRDVTGGRFTFPNELGRFNPKRLSGDSIRRFNRVLLYYLSKDLGYDSPLYVTGLELGEMGVPNRGREWNVRNGINIDNYRYVSDPIVVTNGDGDEETLLNYRRVERRGTTRVYNASLVDGIDSTGYVTVPDPDAPSNVVDLITSAGAFYGMKMVVSDRFGYDGDAGTISIRPMNGETDVDYAFEVVETMMGATGSVYRHQSQLRKFKNRGLEKIPFEEMMVVKFATLMYLADEMVDISEVSDSLVTIDREDVLADFRERLRSKSVMSHYANDAAAAVNVLRKHLGR